MVLTKIIAITSLLFTLLAIFHISNSQTIENLQARPKYGKYAMTDNDEFNAMGETDPYTVERIMSSPHLQVFAAFHDGNPGDYSDDWAEIQRVDKKNREEMWPYFVHGSSPEPADYEDTEADDMGDMQNDYFNDL